MYKRKMVKRYELKRLFLKYLVHNEGIKNSSRVYAQAILDRLPRNSSATRVKNFCALTGRSKGVKRYFCASRIKIKELALRGKIPGLNKASW